MTVVSDSSPIIALARVSKLHLLRDLFGEILIPDGIYNELAKKGRAGAEEVERGLFIKREQIKNRDAVLIRRVGQADAEVIILAKEKTADLILADDTRVIREVKEKGISFATITSILLEAKRRKLLASVKEVMDEMRRQGVGINDNTYEETLRQAGEIT